MLSWDELRFYIHGWNKKMSYWKVMMMTWRHWGKSFYQLLLVERCSHHVKVENTVHYSEQMAIKAKNWQLANFEGEYSGHQK